MSQMPFSQYFSKKTTLVLLLLFLAVLAFYSSYLPKKSASVPGSRLQTLPPLSFMPGRPLPAKSFLRDGLIELSLPASKAPKPLSSLTANEQAKQDLCAEMERFLLPKIKAKKCIVSLTLKEQDHSLMDRPLLEWQLDIGEPLQNDLQPTEKMEATCSKDLFACEEDSAGRYFRKYSLVLYFDKSCNQPVSVSPPLGRDSLHLEDVTKNGPLKSLIAQINELLREERDQYRGNLWGAQEILPGSSLVTVPIEMQLYFVEEEQGLN